MLPGLGEAANAAVTITGIELAHRIRERQFMLSRTYRHNPVPLVDGYILSGKWRDA